MSDKSGGFFSSVGRFFSSGNKSKDSEKSPVVSLFDPIDETPSTPPPSSARSSAEEFLKDIITIDRSSEVADDNPRPAANLRYLSPSALDRSTANGLEIDVEPVSDIFLSTPSMSTNRKRHLTELDKQFLPKTFGSESVKRSRFLNRSLLEPTLKSSLTPRDRLDATWSGELTGNHSPASSITNFSLLSRRSGQTNGSLSTRTQEIFKKLEGANTPAKEIQRMTMLRAGLTRPERWAPSSTKSETSSAPPLKKAGDVIPSRIQLISKSMAMTAKQAPYWRDLTRKRGESKNGDTSSSETHSLRSLNGAMATTELSSLFSLDAPVGKKSVPSTASTTSTTSTTKKPHVAILKGPDGKPVSRNTFKLTDDIEEEEEDVQKLPPLPAATLSNPKPLVLAPESIPKAGFLNTLSFSFRSPADSAESVAVPRNSSTVTVTSKDVDSDSSDGVTFEKQTSESSETSSGSDDESVGSESDNEDEVESKQSRPQTSTDTVSTANGSGVSNQSSKDSSPKSDKTIEPSPVEKTPVAAPVAAAAKWSCSECFTEWDQSLKGCGCCGTPRGGASAQAAKPAEKQLVSNLKDFAAKSSGSTFSFGFGSGPSTTTAAAPATVPAANATSTTKPAFGGFGLASSTASTTTSSPFGASKPESASNPAPAAPAAAPAASATDRVDWMCPDCFVSCKATDDKCACCGHVKYASADPGASSNVFGARAFKPQAPSSGGPAPSFGFGVSAKPAPTASAPAAAPVAAAPTTTIGFGNSTIPAAITTAPEPVKSAGSLFGNIPKPAESVTSSTVPLFGSSASTTSSTTGSMFGVSSSKPAEPAKTTSLFGVSSTTTAPAPAPAVSVAPTAPADTTTFGGLSKPKDAPAPAASIFGNASSFGGSGTSLFGSSKTSDVLKPAPTSAISFTAPTTTSDAPKLNLFGTTTSATTAAPASGAPSTTTSLFGSGSSNSLSSMFSSSTKPADSTSNSTAPSMFGKPLSFGGDVGTTTTDGGVPAKRGMFSTDPPKLSFGGDSKPLDSKPAFGGFGASSSSTTTGSLFGGAASSTTPAASLFGGPASTAAPAKSISGFGSTSGFGGTTAAPSTGFSFGSKPPGLSTSSSTNSLFSQAPADTSNPFGTTKTNGGFNFGGSSSTAAPTANGGIFQFGSAAPAAPATGGAFQFGSQSTAPTQPSVPGAFQFGAQPTAPAAPGMDNAFSYQAPTGNGGARKMAMARRRNVRK